MMARSYFLAGGGGKIWKEIFRSSDQRGSRISQEDSAVPGPGSGFRSGTDRECRIPPPPPRRPPSLFVVVASFSCRLLLLSPGSGPVGPSERTFGGEDAASSLEDQERLRGSLNGPWRSDSRTSSPRLLSFLREAALTADRWLSTANERGLRRLDQHHLRDQHHHLLLLNMGSRPGLVLYLLSACLLVPLHLPEARASYHPQSGECRGRKDCSGTAAGPCGAVRGRVSTLPSFLQ
ncbi:hypothetical protein D4764_15G0004950 [Takifugu flavidus]|uniref:Uncharacterized protein n=1 Tax=Takifugu flavidus TaxID=433684 RepID=A0A5C6P2W9_9TELE|nr:hypothetical protein D4764_15G0004950 [Takifugu flavidus]